MKLLAIDDHPVLRQGLSALLSRIAPDTTVLLAPTVAEGLDLLAREDGVSAVLLDLALPGLSGMPAVEAVRRAWPDMSLIVLSASELAGDMREALRLGASGYIPKSTPPETLLAAVSLVLAGGIYVPPHLLDNDGNIPNTEERPTSALTSRQIDILRAVSAGLANKDIAVRFGLSEKTVKVHVSAIFRALGVVNRTQAAAASRRLGFKPIE